MKKSVKYIVIGIAALLVVIQLIPVDRNNPPVTPELELQALEEVMAVFKVSCYDCHSNQTKWPLYSYVAPVSWLVAHDVEEGRDELNFSEWQKYSEKKKQKKMEEIVEETSGDEMPLPIYLFMHSDVKLSDQQKEIIKKWGGAVADEHGEEEGESEEHEEDEQHR